MNINKFLTSAAIGLAAMSFVATTANAADATKEKCYGVAKAGANDCGGNPAHSCAGKATANGAADEFVLTPKGLCARLANGTVKADEAKKEAPKK